MLSTFMVAVPVMALLTVLQTSILPHFSFIGVTPSFPFLFALAWTLLTTTEEGLVWAFVAGLFMDIFTIAPLGGLSLSYVIAVLAASLIRDLLPDNRVAVPFLFAALATAVQQLLYYFFLRLFGRTPGTDLTAFLQLILVQAVLVLPIFGFMSLIKSAVNPRPVKI